LVCPKLAEIIPIEPARVMPRRDQLTFNGVQTGSIINTAKQYFTELYASLSFRIMKVSAIQTP